MKRNNTFREFKSLFNGTILPARKNQINYKTFGLVTTFLRFILALLLRAGFIFIQLGSIPVENVYLILLQNIVDFAVSTASFGLIGYYFSFGHKTFKGLFGYDIWLISDDVNYDEAIMGFSANMIASAVLTTLLSGRMHFLGYVLNSFAFSSIMQPLIIYWIWNEDGWLHEMIFLKYKMSLKDNSGALVIHVTAAMAGAIGAMFLGRRLLKLEDVDESSLGSESPGTTIIGYIFIILGLIGFTLPAPNYETTHYPFNYIGLVLSNNLMGMASGIISSVILNFILSRNTFNYWIILRCIQGGVAGLVSISAGVDVYNPFISFGIGLFGGAIFYAITNLINLSSIEDYCNIIAIHLGCGIFSAITPPFVAVTENLGFSVSTQYKFLHFIWQMFGSLATIFIISLLSCLIFALLYVTGFLRNETDKINHKRSMNASRIERSCCLQRVFRTRLDTPLIEPGAGGKLPEISLNSKKSQDFSRTTEILGKHSEKDTKIPERRVSYADSIGEIPNTKFIYTLHEIIHDVPPPVTLNCSGDCPEVNKKNLFYNKKTNLVEEKLKIKLQKTKSYYVLHRTRKCVNLNRTRRQIRRNVKLMDNDLKTTNLKRDQILIDYDNKFDDGIITIKKPPKKKKWKRKKVKKYR